MGGGDVGGGGGGSGGQGGYERRSEAFVKIQCFLWGVGGVGLGVRVDVNGEVKFFCFFFIWGGGGRAGGVRSGVGVGEWGSKVLGRWVMWGMEDVNQE